MKNDTFELKDEHILLLQSMYWEYSDCETGAPAVDCKRPYGNSYVPPDVAEILGIELSDDDDKREEQETEVMQFHYGTHTALEIILQFKSFKTGTFKKVKDGWDHKWERVK
jgi:hypothetical protein